MNHRYPPWYTYFHIRRINDAIMEVASPANANGHNGTSTLPIPIINTKTPRKERAKLIMDSLFETEILTYEELKEIKRILRRRT